ncbi:MAG TPA: DNA polymerase IV [Thermoanaerobaculia bacterium]|nr:DNA polymerase IV [Thermoanaerobaculia bacterium]HUM31184.1 DNA polymerase IV [Thermoanaerobaculia bacterium]HXK69516.1 DNA polymerase IV [Thermoanaerobaculia bacterium]
MLGCLDLDAFFVAVERIRDPSLRGRPVIVGGDPEGRGVVCSASYEARAFGVHSGMASATARRLCPGAVFLPPDGQACLDYSRNVGLVLQKYSPLVEQASIDEFFFSLDGCERLYRQDLPSAGNRIRGEIRAMGLTASIGFGSSRATAKIASTLAKPDGQLAVLPGQEALFLSPFPVETLPGVGPKARKTLGELGLKTVGDIQRLSPALLAAALGRHGISLHERASGQGSATLHAHHEHRGMSAEDTFPEDITDMRTLLTRLFWLTEKVVYRMRKKGMACRTITVKIRYGDFVTATRSGTLPVPTDAYPLLRTRVEELFTGLYERRLRVRLVGVALSNLTGGRQRSLVHIRRELLEETVDRLRDRHGLKAISMGSS